LGLLLHWGLLWLRDSLLMRNAAVAAYKAAQTKDLAALEGLNNALYESCESCHMATR
jgi:cytochrome c556